MSMTAHEEKNTLFTVCLCSAHSTVPAVEGFGFVNSVCRGYMLITHCDDRKQDRKQAIITVIRERQKEGKF